VRSSISEVVFVQAEDVFQALTRPRFIFDPSSQPPALFDVHSHPFAGSSTSGVRTTRSPLVTAIFTLLSFGMPLHPIVFKRCCRAVRATQTKRDDYEHKSGTLERVQDPWSECARLVLEGLHADITPGLSVRTRRATRMMDGYEVALP
jgi:hypothetical protein